MKKKINDKQYIACCFYWLNLVQELYKKRHDNASIWIKNIRLCIYKNHFITSFYISLTQVDSVKVGLSIIAYVGEIWNI